MSFLYWLVRVKRVSAMKCGIQQKWNERTDEKKDKKKAKKKTNWEIFLLIAA